MFFALGTTLGGMCGVACMCTSPRRPSPASPHPCILGWRSFLGSPHSRWGGRACLLHNHFVINSISYVDGKHYHDNKKNLRLLRKRSDELCREYSLAGSQFTPVTKNCRSVLSPLVAYFITSPIACKSASVYFGSSNRGDASEHGMPAQPLCRKLCFLY